MGAGQAYACSCTADAFQPAASRKNIARAQYIVQGHVSFVAPVDEEKTAEYKGVIVFGIVVEKTLKGDSSMKMLTAYAHTKSTCGVSVESLQRMDFFVLYKKDDTLTLAGSCENYLSAEDRLALMHGVYKK